MPERICGVFIPNSLLRTGTCSALKGEKLVQPVLFSEQPAKTINIINGFSPSKIMIRERYCSEFGTSGRNFKRVRLCGGSGEQVARESNLVNSEASAVPSEAR